VRLLGRARAFRPFIFLSRLLFLWHDRGNSEVLQSIVPGSILSLIGDFWSPACLSGDVNRRMWLLLSSSPSITREETLDASNEIGSADVESVGDFENRRERRVVFAPFQQTDVFRMVSTIEREGFLRKAALVSERH
jgi:hypothetical protein